MDVFKQPSGRFLNIATLVLLSFSVLLVVAAFIARPNIDDLAAASMNGESAAVRRLLKENPFKKDQLLESGEYPMVYAVNYNYVDVVKAFLESGADHEVRSQYLETPLLTATYYRRDDIINLLIDHGANVNIRDKDDLTPALWAARFGLLEQLKLLSERGANIDARTRFGGSPLSVAISLSNDKEALFLIANGADKAQQDFLGVSPIHLATFFHRKSVFDVLISQSQAVLSKPDKAGQTPLDFALLKNDTQLVGHLLNKKVDLEAKDKLGHSQLFRLLLTAQKSPAIAAILSKNARLSDQECAHWGSAASNLNLAQYCGEPHAN